MNSRMETVFNTLTNYLNNILSINLLLVSLAIIILWNFKDERKKSNILIYASILIGIFAIIFGIFSYRDIIGDIFHTGLNSQEPRIPTPEKFLYRLNWIFWMDIVILTSLTIRFYLRDKK